MKVIEPIFKYGEEVVDKLTGLTGKVTAYGFYYGKHPDSYLVESIDSTGRPISHWVDEDRLRLK